MNNSMLPLITTEPMFDHWTAARPSSEWPTRQLPSSPARAESGQRPVDLATVPPPTPPAEAERERRDVAHVPGLPEDLRGGPDRLDPVNEPQPEPDCRRRHKRVDGPFDGLRVGALETPVQLYDLSRGGCFINSMHQQQPGIKMLLKIDLPYEGWITVTAETLYRRGEFGFAVRFVDMSVDASTRLEKALQALAQRALHEA